MQVLSVHSVLAISSKMSVLCALMFLLQLELSHADEIPCSNIEHSLRSNDTNIVFEDCGNGVFNLTSQFSRSMASDLYITGDEATVIECSNNTGMLFKNITNIFLKNLQIRNCYDQEFIGSIYIVDCTNITIKNITIENSRGTGLVLENNKGDVVIENCTFQNNGHANENYYSDRYDKLKGGGGLKVLIGGDVKNSSVLIQTCLFLNNIAFSGGGMLIAVGPSARQNTVIILNSFFIGNKCYNSGGGLRIGYITSEEKTDGRAVRMNSITVQKCNFTGNNGLHGGGTAVFSTSGSVENKFEFTDCLWVNNTANLGMAVNVAMAPGEALTGSLLSYLALNFTGCSFFQHKLSTGIRRSNNVLSATRFVLNFRRKTVFAENKITAIEATSAKLHFLANSRTEFIKNQGIYGGAIKFNEQTVMTLQDNATLFFEENKATIGGAIYVDRYTKSSQFRLSEKIASLNALRKQEMHPLSFLTIVLGLDTQIVPIVVMDSWEILFIRKHSNPALISVQKH